MVTMGPAVAVTSAIPSSTPGMGGHHHGWHLTLEMGTEVCPHGWHLHKGWWPPPWVTPDVGDGDTMGDICTHNGCLSLLVAPGLGGGDRCPSPWVAIAPGMVTTTMVGT